MTHTTHYEFKSYKTWFHSQHIYTDEQINVDNGGWKYDLNFHIVILNIFPS